MTRAQLFVAAGPLRHGEPPSATDGDHFVVFGWVGRVLQW